MRATDRHRPQLLRVVLSGDYPGDDLERLIGDLDPLARVSEPVTLELDVRELTSLCAPAAAWLVAVVERARHADLLAHAAIVDSPRGSGMATASPTESDDEATRPYRFLQRFERHEHIPVLTRQVAETLVARGVLDSTAGVDLRLCLDELAENVVFHADSGIGGVLTAVHEAHQARVDIGIADVGIGLRESLRRNSEYADVIGDLDAAVRALQPRVTSTPHRNAGMGLAVTSTTFQDNGGRLHVRSGTAALAVTAGGITAATTLHLPGTLIAARVRTDRPLNTRVAYFQHESHFEALLRERGIVDGDNVPPG